jgi:hypothetical protein
MQSRVQSNIYHDYRTARRYRGLSYQKVAGRTFKLDQDSLIFIRWNDRSGGFVWS